MVRMRTLCVGFVSLVCLIGAGVLLSPGLPAQEESKPDAEKKADEAAKPNAEASAKTHTVKAGPFRIETELEGVLESASMMPISLRPEIFKTLEVVKAVAHGTPIKKGEPLVWLETKDLDEEIRETELSVELGELSLKSAKEDLAFFDAMSPLNLAQAERSLMVAERNLRQYLDTDQPLAVRSAKHSLKSSEGQLENAAEELNQLEKMYKADDLTEETEEIILKRARRSVESAELFLELAKVRTERTLSEEIPEREIQLTEAAKREELALAKLKVSMPVQRRQQEIALEKLERTQEKLVEKLGKLKQDRAMLNVTAPVDGVVYYGDSQDGKWANVETIAKQLEPGKTLTANQVFMTIVALRPMHVRLGIAEKDIRYMEKGLAGEAIPTAYPDRKLSVTLKEIANIPDGSNKFDATAEIELKDIDRLVPGMTCKVKFTAYEKKEALAIPESALFQEEADPEKSFVYISGKDKAGEKRFVTAGKKHGGKVEITEGLNDGDIILTEKPKDE